MRTMRTMSKNLVNAERSEACKFSYILLNTERSPITVTSNNSYKQ